MSRQKRVLIVENTKDWLDILSLILGKAGYTVTTAATTSDAREKLKEGFYHLLVLDIRIEDDSDESDVEGMNLLKELYENGFTSAVQIIMLSAYGTSQQMRDSFRRYLVADFQAKDEFNRDEFIRAVNDIFAKRAEINLDLQIHWGQVKSPQQAVVDLLVDEKRVKPDTPLQISLAEELDDLLCRLFHKAQSLIIKPLTAGHGGSGVLRVQPFYPSGSGQEVVVKFGDYRKIDLEYQNFKKYIQPFVGGARATSVLDLRRTKSLGGIVYSFLGATSDHLQSFESYYSQAAVPEIKAVLDHLFFQTCGTWYANPGQNQPHNLTQEYLEQLGYQVQHLEKIVAERLKSVQLKEKQKLHFNDLSIARDFTDPIRAGADQNYVVPTYLVTNHGDFNEANILVDENGKSWLIDFEVTGRGHILRDVVKLDSVLRFQALKEDHATLEERLAMEEALCSIRKFSQIGELTNNFSTDNQSVAKTFAIATHLMSIAGKLTSQNPGDDMNEYYIGLFYHALNTIRFYQLSKLQRQHALLSASLLIDRFGS